MSILKFKKEKLCKELERCIVGYYRIPMIKHRLMNVFYDTNPNIKNYENGKLNKIFRKKKKDYKEYFKKNNFESISFLIERPWRIPWLYENKELIVENTGLNVFYEILGDVFNDTENAHEFTDMILELFYFGANPLLMMDDEELIEYNKLPDFFKIWRGVESGDDIDELDLLGCSWTLDFKQARWFANRGYIKTNPYPLIFGLEIKKEDVLSLITRRKENEIIIDFTKIDINKLEHIYPNKELV